MTTDYRIFYIIDEFCKHFYAENAENLLEDNSEVRRRRRQASLSDSEIITILLFFSFWYIPQFQTAIPAISRSRSQSVLRFTSLINSGSCQSNERIVLTNAGLTMPRISIALSRQVFRLSSPL